MIGPMNQASTSNVDKGRIKIDVSSNGLYEALMDLLSQRYSIVNDNYDVLIIDSISLNAKSEEIKALRNGGEFIPMLLILTRNDRASTKGEPLNKVDEFIVEPIEKVELLARIETLLVKRRQFLKSKRYIEISERELGTLLSSIDLDAFLISPDYEILYANSSAFEKLRANGIKKFLGEKCYKILQNAEEPLETCPCARAMMSGRVEVEHMRDDATGREYVVVAKPVFKEGKLEGIVQATLDITEKEILKRRTRELDSLLSFVTEINALLATEKNEENLLLKIVGKLSEYYSSAFLAVVSHGALKFYPSSLEDAACVKMIMHDQQLRSFEPGRHIDGCKHIGLHGHLYGLIIPIVYDQIFRGVLVLHSERRFSESELELLVMLAYDIGFALNAQKVAKMKEMAAEQLKSDIEKFAMLIDSIRNPLAAAQGYVELYVDNQEVKEKINKQFRRILELVEMIEAEWIAIEDMRKLISGEDEIE